MKTEKVKCRICGDEYQRKVFRIKKDQVCKSKKCVRMSKFGTEQPLGFTGFYTGYPSKQRAVIDYHGSPNL